MLQRPKFPQLWNVFHHIRCVELARYFFKLFRSEDGRNVVPYILLTKLWINTWVQFEYDVLLSISIECSLIRKCRLCFRY